MGGAAAGECCKLVKAVRASRDGALPRALRGLSTARRFLMPLRARSRTKASSYMCLMNHIICIMLTMSHILAALALAVAPVLAFSLLAHAH